MKCATCGRDNVDSAKFCGGCGTALLSDQIANIGQLPRVKFSAAVEMGIRQYWIFQGRSTRAEYWWFTLFLFIGSSVCAFIDSGVGITFEASSWIGRYITLWISGVFGGIWGLATLIPDLAVGARRLHDINKSAWWLLLYFTIIGIILLMFWAIRQGDAGENQYGADPRQAPLP